MPQIAPLLYMELEKTVKGLWEDPKGFSDYKGSFSGSELILYSKAHLGIKTLNSMKVHKIIL